jgi:hypothetical protein
MNDESKMAEDLLSLLTQEAARFGATIKKFDMARHILDVDCPEENKVDCAMALQRILDGQAPDVN